MWIETYVLASEIGTEVKNGSKELFTMFVLGIKKDRM